MFSNLITRVKVYLSTPQHAKLLSIIAIISVILAIPITVFIAQRQQELRQHAAGLEDFATLISPPAPTNVCEQCVVDARHNGSYTPSQCVDACQSIGQLPPTLPNNYTYLCEPGNIPAYFSDSACPGLASPPYTNQFPYTTPIYSTPVYGTPVYSTPK